MQSGSPIPVGDITNGQKDYDALVAETGCTSSSDTLQCLRQVPFTTLMNAVNMSPSIFSFQVRHPFSIRAFEVLIILRMQSLDLAWLPRADGVFITEDPQSLVTQGTVANIPFVTGVSVTHLLRNSCSYLTYA